MAASSSFLFARRCTGGKAVKCTAGYWQPLTKQNFADACKKCPDYSTSVPGSKLITDCACIGGGADGEGYYDNNFGPDALKGPDCKVCPIGIDCSKSGSTRFNLRLKQAY